MENLNTICEKLNSNFVVITDNLQQESIDVYNFIQKEYNKGNVSQNNIFKFAFRSFYKLDSAGLTQEFKDKFFVLFEKNSNLDNIEMRATLEELSRIPNFKNQLTVQFSFVTKMFHTINTEMPIYDNEVISVFGFRQPYTLRTTNLKIDEYIRQYEVICNTYRSIKTDNSIKQTIDAFNNKFPEHNLPQTMVTDFIFWSAGKLIRKKMI